VQLIPVKTKYSACLTKPLVPKAFDRWADSKNHAKRFVKTKQSANSLILVDNFVF